MILLLFAAQVGAQEEAVRYETGRIQPEPKRQAQMHATSLLTHWEELKNMAQATERHFDCVELGWCTPIKNQGSCGSCWDFSGIGVIESAYLKKGFKIGYGFSEQYIMNCAINGGCNGDNNSSVVTWAKQHGVPLTAEYEPYQARRMQCVVPKRLFKIDDWGYCSPGKIEQVANTQDIKNAMKQYGAIGVAIAADQAFMNNPKGHVFKGNARGINHDVILVGWDDDKGAWKLRNSWGKGWCDEGYCWIAYGANGVGTEALWASVKGSPIPQPDPPHPTGSITITLTNEQVKSIQVQSGETKEPPIYEPVQPPVQPIQFFEQGVQSNCPGGICPPRTNQQPATEQRRLFWRLRK